MLRQFLELEFVSAMEGALDCSGFCKSALFYWDKDIYSGFPTETCGQAAHGFFKEAAAPLTAALRVMGTTLVFIFLLHFTLYDKTPRRESSIRRDAKQSAGPAAAPGQMAPDAYELQAYESRQSELIEPSTLPQNQQDKENNADVVGYE